MSETPEYINDNICVNEYNQWRNAVWFDKAYATLPADYLIAREVWMSTYIRNCKAIELAYKQPQWLLDG